MQCSGVRGEGGSRHRFGHAQKLMAVRQDFNRLIIFIFIFIIIVLVLVVIIIAITIIVIAIIIIIVI